MVEQARSAVSKPPSGDAGAAVVDVVLVFVLLLLVLFGVLQVGVYVYARTVIASAAADGARYAANADMDPAAGGRRAQALVAAGLTTPIASAVPCTGTAARDSASGLALTTVRCTGRLRLLFLPLQLPLTMDVRASALREGQP